MGTPIDLPILFSNLPAVAKMVNPEFTQAANRQAILSPLIAEQQKLARSQVQEVEKTEGPDTVDQDGRPKQEAEERHHRRQDENEAEKEPSTMSSNASPWTGNILNLKI
ncbi:MAG: hypothetical protein ACOCVM_05785 [Desulfovibrionaceae bacterium]